jgi:hypothetical protein
MSLATAAALRFQVFIGADAEGSVSSGGDVAVMVAPGASTGSQEWADQVSAVLDAFAHLAGTGALGGASVPPGKSAAGFTVQASEHPLRWLFRDCWMDPRALVVLSNWMQAVTPAAIAALRLGSPPYTPLLSAPAARQYPELAASVYCTVRMPSIVGPDVRLVIQPSHPLTDAQEQDLLSRLCTTSTAIALGAYGEAPNLDRGDGCTFEDQFDLVEDSPAFCLWRLRADEAAVVGLANVCQAFFDEIGLTAQVDVES